VRIDRAFGDDAGRRGLLAVFELCDDAALVRDYRRRLSAGLY
jgi:thioredoxin-like negative regulator of GroEL